jgi:hypothetical protein
MRRLALPATVRLAFLATATVLLVGRASLAVEDGAPTPAQLRSKIGALLAQYRNPKLDLDKRGEIVRELFELGEEGVRRAVPELARDFAARHKAYPTKFAKAAEKVMAKRAKAREFKQEVDRLRKEVLAARGAVVAVAGGRAGVGRIPSAGPRHVAPGAPLVARGRRQAPRRRRAGR